MAFVSMLEQHCLALRVQFVQQQSVQPVLREVIGIGVGELLLEVVKHWLVVSNEAALVGEVKVIHSTVELAS